MADERFGRLAVFQLTLALGADQDLKQLWGEGHDISDSGKPKRVRAVELLRQWGRTLTQQSRYTGSPMRASIRRRARAPMALSVWPPAPMTIRFCDSRSTNRFTRMYTGCSASRNSSTSAVKP